MTVLSTKQTTAWAEVDEQGRLILPPEVARQYGLNPGSKVRTRRRAQLCPHAPSHYASHQSLYRANGCLQPRLHHLLP